MAAFLRGFWRGVQETPAGYFAPVLMVWRVLRQLGWAGGAR